MLVKEILSRDLRDRRAVARYNRQQTTKPLETHSSIDFSAHAFMTCPGQAIAIRPSATSLTSLKAVPYGVSNELGAVAYATAIVEISAQAAEHHFDPTAIVHCTGSGGTQAGLVVGAAVVMPQARVVGIDIDSEPERVRADVIK